MKKWAVVFCLLGSFFWFGQLKAGDDGFFPLEYVDAQWTTVEGDYELLFVESEPFPQVLLFGKSQNFFALGRITKVSSQGQIDVVFQDMAGHAWQGQLVVLKDGALSLEMKSQSEIIRLRMQDRK